MATRVLRTARLDLEPLRVDHADELVAVLADTVLYAHLGDDGPPSLEALRARYARQSAGASPDGLETWHNWVLRDRSDGRAVGFVQATVVEVDGVRSADLAWVVGTASQGRGLATEAALAVRDAVLRPSSDGGDGARAVRAHIAPGNLASEAVARHLGLAPTGEVDADGERLWRAPAR